MKNLTKMPEEEAMELCTMISLFTPPKTIIKAFADNYKRVITPQTIQNYMRSQKYGPVIAQNRKEYLAALESVPLYNKRVRLDRIQEILDQASQEKVTGVTQSRDKRKETLSIIKQAQDEAERYKFESHTNIVAIQLNQLTDQQLTVKLTDIGEKIEKLRQEQQGGQKNAAGQAEDAEWRVPTVEE